MFWNKKKNELPEPPYEWKILGYGIMNDNGLVYACNGLFIPNSYSQIGHFQIYKTKEEAEQAKEELGFRGLKVFAAKCAVRKEQEE